MAVPYGCSVFFLNDRAPTEIYPLPLPAALPIPPPPRPSRRRPPRCPPVAGRHRVSGSRSRPSRETRRRSEEHTSELQSRQYLVCRLLLEKKNTKRTSRTSCPTCRPPSPTSTPPC